MYKGRVRVFLAEDEAAILRFVGGILRRMKEECEVVGCAQNGADALAEIGRLSPDIVITDIIMPMMDGLELMRRAFEVCPEARFIVLTGHERFDFAQRAIELQAVSYLLKPINVEKLEKTVRDLVASIREERRERIRGQLRAIYLSRGRAQEGFRFSGGCLYLLSAIHANAAVEREAVAAVPVHLEAEMEALLPVDCGAGCYAVDTLSASERCVAVLAEKPCDEAMLPLAHTLGAMAFPGEEMVALAVSERITEETQISAAMERIRVIREAPQQEGADPAEQEIGLGWRVRRYLDTMLRQEFDRGALSTYFGYNKNYLTTLFSKCFGLSPGQYHTKQRIELAKEIIGNQPEEKMQDVAARIGYGDSLYFSRVFKAQTGYSPREYAKKCEYAQSLKKAPNETTESTK